MTARERFKRQMNRLPVDRSFNREFGYWQENFLQWPVFYDNGISCNEEADKLFGFDPTSNVGSPWMCPAFPQEEIGRTATSIILRNEDGLIAEVPKDSHSTIPHYIQSSIETPVDWAKVKAERFQRGSAERKPDLDLLQSLHPRDRDYPLVVWCGSMIGKIRDMLTVEGLAYAIYDYPDMVEDMVETSCLLIEDFLDRVLPVLDFDAAAGWEDISCNSGPLVPVDFFANVVVPRYKRIKSKLIAHGIDLWWIDCDGDVRPLIPHFLEGGVNVMFPWEVNGSGHPGEALDRWGPDLRIMGGVDKMILRKDKPSIKAYLESLIPYVHAGGYIPFCDHRCPPDVSQENYFYYLELKQTLFG